MHAPDYNALIDEQTWAFIRQTHNAFPEDAVHLSIDEQRQLYDAMCSEFEIGYPAGVIATDYNLAAAHYDAPSTGCAIRQYRTASDAGAHAQVIYLHGGGFVVGGLNSHDDICAEIADATHLPLISVDYRLSPEHTHPAAFDDAQAAVRHAWADKQKPIVLVGDSAGGNLAAALSHKLRGSFIPIIGQVLIYPGLGGDMDSGSYVTHANAPMLTTDEVRFYAAIRGGDQSTTSDATQAPLADTDFSQLPPTVIVSAACDPLSDDGKFYQQAIGDAGGLAHWFNEPGLVHGYLRARHQVDRARNSFDRILKAIDALAGQQWPY